MAAIFRGMEPILPTGSTSIEADDEVFFIVAAGQINSVMAELRDVERAFKRVTIAGGGNIGARLAATIERYFNVKLIEFDPGRAERLATTLKDTVVIQGDATNPDQLRDATGNSDVFCALTNDDEVNIMSSLMAKRYGVRRVMTLISKPAYADLMRTSEIDVAISPQQSTTSSLLTHVRRGDVARVHSLRRGRGGSHGGRGPGRRQDLPHHRPAGEGHQAAQGRHRGRNRARRDGRGGLRERGH